MAFFLFALYLVLFATLVSRIPFFKKSGLSSSQLMIVFLLKVMAGILYGWVGVYYGKMAQMIDTWNYHYMSIQETKLLLSDPVEFIVSLFRNTYPQGYSNFFETSDSWWNNLKANSFVKVLAVFNVFSGGHYYVNVIFYSFLTLIGPISVYRVMQDVFPGRRLVVLLSCFLLPSFLYWTSGLHKEGIIFIGVAMMIYHTYFGLKERFSLYRVAIIMLNFLLVLALRNFMVIPMLACFAAWIIAEKSPRHQRIVFGSLMLIFVVLFFTLKYVHPALDFPAAVVQKQQEFLALGGNSAVPVRPLMPDLRGFIANAPQAVSLSMLRPYPSDVKHLLSLAACVEVMFLLFCFILFILYHKRAAYFSPFLCFSLTLSLSVLLMVGYSVNVLGAIVRYRSLVLPFVVIPMMAFIDWKKITAQVFSNI